MALLDKVADDFWVLKSYSLGHELINMLYRAEGDAVLPEEGRAIIWIREDFTFWPIAESNVDYWHVFVQQVEFEFMFLNIPEYALNLLVSR